MSSKRIENIRIRVTEKEKHRIKILADLYAGGNVTAWLIHGALNAPRKKLTLEDVRKR